MWWGTQLRERDVNYGKDYDGTEEEETDSERRGREEWRDMQADALYDQAQEEGLDND